MKNKSKILVLSAIALFGMTAAVAPEFSSNAVRTMAETKSNSQTFANSSVSGWSISSQTTYCSLYYSGKGSATSITNKSISDFSVLQTASSATVSIKVSGICNSGTNSVNVSLVNSSGTVVTAGTALSDQLGNGSSASKEKESAAFVFENVGKTVTGIKVDIGVKCCLTKISWEITYSNAPAEEPNGFNVELKNTEAEYYEGDIVSPLDLKIIPTFASGSSGTPVTDGDGVEILSGAILESGNNTLTIKYTFGNFSGTKELQISGVKSESEKPLFADFNLTDNSYIDGTDCVYWTNSIATYTLTGANYNNYYPGKDNDHTRIYSGGMQTYSVINGYKITSIEVTGTESSYSNTLVDGTWSDGTTELVNGVCVYTPNKDVSSVTSSVTSTTRLQGVKISYARLRSLTKIEIVTGPSKKTYNVGETFDTSGMVIKATYDNGDTENPTGYTVSPSVISADTTEVTVTFGGLTAVISGIDVTQYNGIRVSADSAKVAFRAGEKFDPTGLVVEKKLSHSNGDEDSYESVTSGLVYSIDGQTVTTDTVLTKGDDQVVTVSYTEGGVTNTATYTIDVGSPYVTSITPRDTEVTLGPGSEYTVTATISPSDADQTYRVQEFSGDGQLTGKYSLVENKLTISDNIQEGGDLILKVFSNDVDSNGSSVSETITIHVLATKVSTITSVTVSGNPTQSVQYAGKSFNPNGLTFAPVYDNDSDTPVTITGSDIVWNTLVAGQNPTGVYTYDGGNRTVSVEVSLVQVQEDALGSLVITGSLVKTEYFENEESFSTEGLVIEGRMKSGDSVAAGSPLLEGATLSIYQDKKPSDCEVGSDSFVVVASLDGVQEDTETFDVTIKENKFEGIEVVENCMKTSYILGETIDTTGLTINAIYSNSSENITSGFTTNADSIDMFSVGDKALTVTYNEKTANVVIHVDTKSIETVTQFSKVTTAKEDWSGTYLLGHISDNSVKVFNGVDADNAVIDTTHISGVIADSDSLVTVSVAKMSGGYSVKIDNGEKAGKYIGGKSGSNSIVYSDTAVACSFSIDNSGNVTISNNSTQFSFNSSANRFRFYKTFQSSVQLFEKGSYTTGTADPIAMNAATFTPTDLDLKVGDKVTASQFSASILSNDGKTTNVSSGLTINGGNEVTLVEGENTITVSYETFSKDVVINARAIRITDLTSVDVATQDDKTTLFGGETTQLFALLSSGEGEPDNKEVTWSSSNEDVATVDQNGLVTTKVVSADNTKVTITATPKDGGTAGSIEITVNKDDVNGIQLVTGPEQIAYKYGETFSAEGLKIKETYESGKTSDPIAYDSSTFTLSIADGATLDHSASTVNVTYGGHTLNNAFTLTVGKIATSLSIENYTSSIFEKQEYKLGDNATATVTYSDGSTDTVTIPEENVSLDTSTFGSVQGEAFIVVDGVKVSTTLVVNVMKDYAAGIQFISGPDTLEYDHNATFNPEGIKLVILHDSNTPEEIDGTDSRLSYSPSTLSTVGKQTITVTFTDAYGNKVSTNLPQQVTVNKTISKVETTSYEVYRDYNAQGTNTPVVGDIYQSDNITIKATIRTTYSDGTTKDVTKLISFGTLVEGENTATTVVDGVTLSFTLENVIGVALSSINLDTANVTKTGYIEGQTADLSGLVVKAHYNNGADVILNSDQYTVTGTTLSAGQNAIIISFGDKSATFYVTADSKQVSNIELVGAQTETYLTADEIANLAGNGYQLKINYNNNTNETIDITQSMVSVDGNTVTITYSGKTATYTIVPLTASNASSITIENSTATVTKGDTYTFNPGAVTAHYTGTNKTVILPAGSYTVDNVVTTEVGTATYYVTINGTDIKASFTINVAYADATGVAINGNTTTIYAPGETATFTATVNPDTADQRVTWTSSDNSVATVENGVVTFKKDGNVTITATSVVDPTKTCQITLTCETPVVNVTGVSLDKTTLTLDVEENPTATLVATVTPNDATNANVTWSTSDGSIVYVDQSGNLSALAEGTATITVTTEDGNKTATCVVTVTAPHVDPVEPQKVGCKGSVVAASAIVSGLAIAGASLLVSKKRKEDK